MRRAVILLAVLAACKDHAVIPADPEPTLPLAPVAPARICVTTGALTAAAAVTAPTFRAVCATGDGPATRSALAFTFRGDTERTRALASGQIRRQVGLKLRAANGCNRDLT